MSYPSPKPGGGEWNHVKEVEDAIRSQKNAIEQLKRALGELRDPAAREWVQRELSDISKMLDELRRLGVDVGAVR